MVSSLFISFRTLIMHSPLLCLTGISAASFPGPLEQKYHGARNGSVFFITVSSGPRRGTLTCVTGDRSCRQYVCTRSGSAGEWQAGICHRGRGLRWEGCYTQGHQQRSRKPRSACRGTLESLPMRAGSCLWGQMGEGFHGEATAFFLCWFQGKLGSLESYFCLFVL